MSKNSEKPNLLIIFCKIVISAYLLLTCELPLPNDMLAGILEVVSRFSELPPPSSFLPFDQFHRHLQKFLLLLSRSPGPARTARTSIYSHKLSSPHHPADPVHAERTHVPVPQTRAAFPWSWSFCKGWFPDSSSASWSWSRAGCCLCCMPYSNRRRAPVHPPLAPLRVLPAEPRSATSCSAPSAVFVVRRERLRG